MKVNKTTGVVDNKSIIIYYLHLHYCMQLRQQKWFTFVSIIKHHANNRIMKMLIQSFLHAANVFKIQSYFIQQHVHTKVYVIMQIFCRQNISIFCALISVLSRKFMLSHLIYLTMALNTFFFKLPLKA